MQLNRRRLRAVHRAILSAASAGKDAQRRTGALTGWMHDPSIQGFGIAEKYRDGRKTGELALKVYVTRKLPKDEVAVPVPDFVEMPSGLRAVTDVESIGTIRLQSNSGRVRPAVPGFGVGCVGVAGGTIGCLVERSAGKKTYFILSNSHVLARSGFAAPGEVSIQPCDDDGGAQPGDVIASLTEAVPLVASATDFPNEMDAAIAELVDPLNATAFIRRIGIPKGHSVVVRAGMQVQKTGRTTDFTIGAVEDPDFATAFDVIGLDGSTRRLGFRNQVLCTRFTDGGDSGAAILNMNGFIVGLHLAGSERVSVFSRIAPILQALRVDISTQEPAHP